MTIIKQCKIIFVCIQYLIQSFIRGAITKHRPTVANIIKYRKALDILEENLIRIGLNSYKTKLHIHHIFAFIVN